MKATVKVGDILYGMWRYSMTFPEWFRIVKVTDKQARAVRLRSRMAQATDGGYGQQGYEMPDLEHQMERREHIVRKNQYGLCTGSKYDYLHLEKWDGQPIWADHMD